MPPGAASVDAHPDATGARRFGARDVRIGGAVGLVFLLFYAGFAPARFKSTDEYGLYLMTESIFERGTLEVPIHRHAHVGADGRLHAPFAIGQAVLALPLYALGKTAARALPESFTRALAGPERVIVRELPAISVERMRPALSAGGAPPGGPVFGGTLAIPWGALSAPVSSPTLPAGTFLLPPRLAGAPRGA